MTMPRYLVENHGSDTEAAKTIFRESIQLARSTGTKKITLVVPAKGGFPSTVFGELLGEEVSKALCKGKPVEIVHGLHLELLIPKQLSSVICYGIVVGAYLSLSDLNQLDSVRSAQAIAYIPWVDEDGKVWKSIWSPVIWGESTWDENPLCFPQDAENELQRLTRSINMSTGLAHPSDKENARRTLNKIKLSYPGLSSEDIRRWAVKNGWQPKHAESLSRLVRS